MSGHEFLPEVHPSMGKLREALRHVWKAAWESGVPKTSTAAGWVLKREPGGHPKGSERDGTLSALVHCSGRGEIMAGWHVLHGEHHSLGCGGLILEACGDFGGVWGFWKCVGILEVCAYGTHEGCVRWSGGSCSGLGSRFSTPGREQGVTGDRG